MAVRPTPNRTLRPRDEVTGTETTGHEWDGIRELDTPLPKWWIYVFYATIAFAVVWMVLYPSVPGITGYVRGVLGYSQRAELETSLASARADIAPYLDRIAAMPLDEIQADPQLSTFAVAGGRAIFAENCAPCHGAGGAGRHTAQAAFPTLVDDDWLWGGTLDAIYTTIDHGIRSPTDTQSRFSLMPRFGADGILSSDQIGAVADYVVGLSQGQPATADGEGATLFAQNCASCHGPAGHGDPAFGAPNLADAIWLYGGTRADIVRQVTDPRQGVMPAWIGRLDDPSRKMVALYVHALGGGL